MNAFIALPIEVRLTLAALAGACLGRLVNLTSQSLARTWSRWQATLGPMPRTWLAYLPIVGALGTGDGKTKSGFARVGPLLVELGLAATFCLLYWWEVEIEALLPPLAAAPPVAHFGVTADAAVHAALLSHLLLLTLMTVASLIDIEERVIPDMVTVPGTLLGLLLAVAIPWSLLPAAAWLSPAKPDPIVDFLRVTSPDAWPRALMGAPNRMSLVVAAGCWLGWCFALLPRRFVIRRGWGRGFQMFLGRLRSHSSTWMIAVMGAVGMAAIVAAWYRAPAAHWAGLVTSLVGLAAGGGLVWSVRIVGSFALRREAMGFGDVTLMAMIGAYAGWQACLMIFFIAPFAGLAIGLVQWIVHRDQEIPYGPFLCVATVAVVVRWADLWEWAIGIFALGWLLPAIIVVCLGAMGIMLGIWRIVRDAVFGTG